jgi:hypothetical protein
VSRATLRDWRRKGFDAVASGRNSRPSRGQPCDNCSVLEVCPKDSYAYLLGLYLGDGTVSRDRKAIFKLRIMCCDDYPGLLRECRETMRRVMPTNAVGTVQREGCTEVYCCSKHWICFFPQVGPGRKHERPIILTPWQRAIVDEYPHELIRGLLHSDGCRVINRVRSHGRQYAYARYFFCNVSDDIRGIFCDTCDALGIEWRQNRWNSISVARRASVAMLDSFVGPKS